MASLKKNILANFIGRFWVGIIGIVFVPVYIHFIGIEAYGLLGVFATFQVVLGLLDMGLSTTLNRELAKFNVSKDHSQYMNNLVFTAEIFYLCIALLIALVLVVASWFFANHWVRANNMSTDTVVMAFILMAINFAVQFPSSLYLGGLMGLQKQVSVNVITVVIATLKGVGSIFVLWLLSPTVIAFLYWQIILSCIQLFFLRRYLWKHLPVPDSKPRFDKAAISHSGRYAVGIMGMSFLVIILTQSDKIILSKLVTLTDFGYYTLAASVSSALAMVLYPVTAAVFPRITELLSKENKTKMLELFHTSSQLVSVIIIPLGISLFIFSHEIILAWTRDARIAANAGPIMEYLVLGTTINSLITIPYQYTLSIGWLRWGINISIVAILFFLPAIFFAVNKYGAIGGAFIWMVLNIAYFIFAMLYLFSRHLREEKVKWYVQDVIRPLLVCLLFAAPFFIINKFLHFTNIGSLFLFGSCLAICYLVTLWIGAPALKPAVIQIINRIKSKVSG